jgi:NDP-sugar pyrophosphorylase family protein
MILAAGFGTRLAELHPDLPKPLVSAGGRPMISWAIDTLRRAGCDTVVVNLHHRAQQLAAWLEQEDHGVRLTLVLEDDILGTGGGILNAAGQLAGDEPFLVCNADTFVAQDLRPMVDAHTASDALATLLIQDRETSRAVLFDAGGRFLGKESWFEGAEDAPAGTLRRGFCGIHVIRTELFALDVPRGFADIFDMYRLAMRGGAELRGFETTAFWSDLGTPDRIRAFEHWLAETGQTGGTAGDTGKA